MTRERFSELFYIEREIRDMEYVLEKYSDIDFLFQLMRKDLFVDDINGFVQVMKDKFTLLKSQKEQEFENA